MNLHVLEVQCAGLLVRVAVNGITVVNVDEPEDRTLTFNLNPYIIAGANSIAVALRLPDEKGAQAGPPAPAFVLSLRAGRHGADPGDAGRLMSYTWQAEMHPLSSGAWTIPFNHTATSAGDFGRWAWQDAAPGPINAENQIALVHAVMALHQQCARGQPDAVLAAHQLKLLELARATGLTETAMRADLAAMLSSIMRAPDFKSADLQASDLILVPLAEGRLVKVTCSDGAAPIRLSGGGKALQLRPIYTTFQGRWALAR
ncbi:MAG: hypothetical protein ACKVQR_16205 [Aquabacterium sp.]